MRPELPHLPRTLFGALVVGDRFRYTYRDGTQPSHEVWTKQDHMIAFRMLRTGRKVENATPPHEPVAVESYAAAALPVAK